MGTGTASETVPGIQWLRIWITNAFALNPYERCIYHGPANHSPCHTISVRVSRSLCTIQVPHYSISYNGSPFAEKISNVLLLKGIPHSRVDVSGALCYLKASILIYKKVSMTMPRPELSELLGISYRRIPVLAIGNDVYCDTSLIASVLERIFTKESGYPDLFPPRTGGGKSDTGMIKAFAMFYGDRPLFELGAASLPYNKFAPEFIKDRSSVGYVLQLAVHDSD